MKPADLMYRLSLLACPCIIPVSLDNGAMEQRKEIRTALFAPVEVRTGKLTCREIIQDISLDGAFIETPRRMPIGEALLLSFTFPSYQETISLACRVVRNDAKGIGIQFSEPSAEAVMQIKAKSIPVFAG